MVIVSKDIRLAISGLYCNYSKRTIKENKFDVWKLCQDKESGETIFKVVDYVNKVIFIAMVRGRLDDDGFLEVVPVLEGVYNVK